MGELKIFLAGMNISNLPAQRVNNILFNVLDNCAGNKMVKDTKRLIKFANPKNIILDSSGYQVLQGEINGKRLTFDSNLPLLETNNQLNISPFHVIRAALDIRPDIMIGLDFPIRKISKKEDQEKEYHYKAKFNSQWAKEIALLREICCPDIELFLPIQAYTTANLAHYMTLIKSVSYDGICMPVRNLKVQEVAIFLIRFYQLGATKIHLLGTSSFSMIALASYCAKNFFEWMSLDATTWRLDAQFKNYQNPLDLSDIKVGDDSSGVENRTMTCECPFCANRTFEYIKNLPPTEKTDLLRSHNFYVTEKLAEDLYENATDILTFQEFLRNRTSKIRIVKDLIESLSIVDPYKDADAQVLESLLKDAA